MLWNIDASQMHSEENKGSSEKNVKRRFKTPEQVTALENFYNGMMAYLFAFLP